MEEGRQGHKGEEGLEAGLCRQLEVVVVRQHRKAEAGAELSRGWEVEEEDRPQGCTRSRALMGVAAGGGLCWGCWTCRRRRDT